MGVHRRHLLSISTSPHRICRAALLHTKRARLVGRIELGPNKSPSSIGLARYANESRRTQDRRVFCSRHFDAMVKSAESRRSTAAAPSKNRRQLEKTKFSSEVESVDISDMSPASEVSDGVYCEELAKKRLSSEFASAAKENQELSTDTRLHAESLVVDSPSYSRFSSLEAEVVAEHLMLSLLQIDRSPDIDPLSKKLIDTLIKTVIEETFSIPKEADLVLMTVKVKTRIICLVLWMICTLVVVYMKCHTNAPSKELLPT